MPSRAKKTIVVAGDAAVDWFLYPVARRDEGENWRLYPASHATVLPGGAYVLAQFIQQALASKVPAESTGLTPPAGQGRIEKLDPTPPAKKLAVEVIGPQPPETLRNVPPQEVIHSNAVLDFFAAEPHSKEKVLRVKQSLGYIGPADRSPDQPLPTSNPKHADLVVIDDSGNGFRNVPGCWPAALDATEPPIIVHKLSRPLAEGPLWDNLTARREHTHIVILSAGDLRSIPGVDISQSLSWERTAKDFVYHIQRSEKLASLQQCPVLIVLFDCDGAIVYRGGDRAQAVLVFDPNTLEGGFASQIPGTMYGRSAVFTASLVAGLLTEGTVGLEDTVKQGLGRMRELWRSGFRLDDGQLNYPVDRLFGAHAFGQEFETCRIEPPTDFRAADPAFWRILDQKTRRTRLLVAEDLVREGESRWLRGVPVGRFGHLRTIDRAEIESYSAIRALITEFLENPDPVRPLSFAVFGPPGSGKSFGVKQVLQSIGDDRLKPRTFNISQFGDYADLVAAFHASRDVALKGKVPVIFFDEFDAAKGDEPLGWLQYFLAPMQDAEFKDGSDTHPIGQAIFVFAGGTSFTFQDFTREHGPEPADLQQKEERRNRLQDFRHAKGPDFVSRLRGYVNVMGPNRQGPTDDAYIIRRAMMLRSLFERNPKAVDMFESQRKVLRIDDGILRACLHISRYRHGARSLEALLDMSRLVGKRRFDLSALPPPDQLDLLFDAQEFLFLARKERIHTRLFQPRCDSAAQGGAAAADGASSVMACEQALIDKAARLIHDRYVRQCEQEGRGSPNAVSYDQLPPDKQRSNLDAAEDIPHKLRVIRHGLRRICEGREPRTPDVSDEEVMKLAEHEHNRWRREQRAQGVIYSEQEVAGRKTSPHMKPFQDLSDNIQQYDIQAIYQLPVILRELGLEMYRFEELDELDDPALLEQLARVVHARYVAARMSQGETAASNPSLVDFDQLSADLQASNRDNAATIPRKLLAIDYGLRRVLPGEEPELLSLTPSEIATMAKLEHARWNWQRILQGWTYKPSPKDAANKTTPHLVPWDNLSPEIQQYDVETVSDIPDLIRAVGYQAYKLSAPRRPTGNEGQKNIAPS